MSGCMHAAAGAWARGVGDTGRCLWSRPAKATSVLPREAMHSGGEMVTTRSKRSSSDAPNTAKSHPMAVAVVGSSGGGAATLGHTDAVQLLEQIQRELARAKNSGNGDEGLEAPAPIIRHALYVSLHSGKGLDHATDDDMATLYAVGCGEEESDEHDSQSSTTKKLQVRTVCTGPLAKVNEEARRLDQTYISASILDGSIRGGLICISADPRNVNRESISAASQMKIAVTGSGGTSLSYMSTYLGVQLVGNAGGSVATTTYTRAVSYVYALVNAWDDKNGCYKWTYSPFAPSKYDGGDAADEKDAGPSLRSVLDSCVPAFVAVCVTCRLLELALLWLKDHDGDVSMASAHYYDLSLFEVEAVLSRLYWQLQYHALPTVCAVVAATSYAPEMGSIVLMASGCASIACGGSALAGLLAGCAVAHLSKRALFGCIRMNVPATMTNVLVAGGVGCVAALAFGGCGLVHLLAQAGSALRSVVRLSFLVSADDGGKTPTPGLGFIFGVLFCYGSKVGYYHSLFLPAILIEMERGEASILEAVDECTLCLVSAGVCAGNIITAHLLTDGDASISKRGVKINLLCGDFIEAAYPFMERSAIVNAFAYLAAGTSTEILYSQTPEKVLSSAYLPFGLSIILAQDVKRMSLACGAAFLLSFVGAVIGNVIGKKRKEE